MSPSRSILLVGEGNFSFSASACQLSSEGEIITATCLQHQDEALRHEGAASNIQTIKDSGGSVLFGVDCTKLGECASLRGRAFDRVIFNFPHCGRKSGVKKNRELLRKFFLSCVHVLAADGEVHVSLCNGQGGTPADQPKREWHNSWQVAAMAAEALLILSDVRPFESETHQNYKCTGYRSQDKGFHVEKALLHVFTRGHPYSSLQILELEEAVEGETVQYNIPAELSDYINRRFLCSDSVHPVKLAQDVLLKGLEERWPVSMMTESLPFLLTASQFQTRCCNVDTTHCYWIHPLQKDVTSDAPTSVDKDKDQVPGTQSVTSDKVDRIRSKAAESLRSACSIDVDPEGESCLYLLRPSLLPQMEELLMKKEKLITKAESKEDSEGNNTSVDIEGSQKEESCNGVSSVLDGVSGLVFRNVPIGLWALPVFHELLLKGVFPSESEPIKMLGEMLEKMLAPYGVSLLTEEGGLCLRAQPMGSVGKVFVSDESDESHISISVSLNLDLLAVLFFSIPDWRVLWSHDPRFLKQFNLRPSPGTPFLPFSRFPEHFSFDISFWTGSMWDALKFHAAAREASRGTVEQVKLIDTFSHPDLSQTSYCYRLTYHSHTHALSHTRALQFHKHLECLLSTRLQVNIR